MFRIILFCVFATAACTDLCRPEAPGAFKVRLSIKKALGERAYTWNGDEEYLFKAVIAFTIRSYTKNDIFQISNILLCNVTQRVSFWFVVTSPSNDSSPFPSAIVEAAIRKERNRINSAFLLDDKTLEFVDILPTLAPATESSRPTWIIVFGVIVSVIAVAIIFLVVSGMLQRRKKKKATEALKESDITTKSALTSKNGVFCENQNFTEGLDNNSFENIEEGLTPL